MPPKRSSPKKTVTLRLPAELVDELRTLCRDWAGKPYYLSVTTFIEAAVSDHLNRLKRQIEGELPSNSQTQRGCQPHRD